MLPDMAEFTNEKFLIFFVLLPALALTVCAGSRSSAEDSLPASPGENLPVDSVVAEAAYKFTLPSGLNSTACLKTYAERENVMLVFYRGFW